MKTRSDFVSNSSSSSFIVATQEPKDSLIDFIVFNAHSKQDGREDYWSDYYDTENKNFLKDNLAQPFIQLVIGYFKVLGNTPKSDWMEESEENAAKKLDFGNTVVNRNDIRSFIKDGKVQLSFEDFKNGNYSKPIYYSSYKVFEITQDTIDFTRWLVSNCDTESNPRWKVLDDFYQNELPEKVRSREEQPTPELHDKWESLTNACNGLMFEPVCEDYTKDENGNWKSESKPVSKLLDEYESLLKAGNKLYRICYGYSGEGTDWGSYIWTDHANFNADQKFKVKYDPWF